MSSHDPYDAWNRMDNSMSEFLASYPDLSPEIREKLDHFRYQYLMKTSPFSKADAARCQLQISPWQSSFYYHRFYNNNRFLTEIEQALDSSQSILLTSYPELLEKQKKVSIFYKQGQPYFPAPKDCQDWKDYLTYRGYTPNLQVAAKMAAQLSLQQSNLSIEKTETLSNIQTFVELLFHPVYLQFKKLSSLPARALIRMIESFPNRDSFHPVLVDSYQRLLFQLKKGLSLTGYPFEVCLDLAYEELLLWLLILEPYQKPELEEAISRAIHPPSFLRVTSSGMMAFNQVLTALLGDREKTILLKDGIYYENRILILTTQNPDSFFVLRSHEPSLTEILTSIQNKNRKIDLFFIDFYESLIPERFESKKNEIKEIVQKLFEANLTSADFTLIIDTTIGYLKSEEIGDLLTFCQNRFHLIILWSHTKFDLFGIDKGGVGTFCLYTHDPNWIEPFKSIPDEPLDLVTRQLLTHFFLHGVDLLEERRKKLFSHAFYINQHIDPRFKQIVVSKSEDQAISVDAHFSKDVTEKVIEEFEKRGVFLLSRQSFGFNYTSLDSTRFHSLRFSIGLEDPVPFTQALNQVLEKLNRAER